MTCNACSGTGFKNSFAIPEAVAELDHDAILKWMSETDEQDVSVCDCCGDGEGWYGNPGEHYAGGDTAGRNGPYASNGGSPKCS